MYTVNVAPKDVAGNREAQKARFCDHGRRLDEGLGMTREKFERITQSRRPVCPCTLEIVALCSTCL